MSWHDDLGGMGAGYAAALGGELHSALGPEDDPASRAVADLLARSGIAHRPIRVPDRPADWTLLITSAEHGDKLPIGFRGCHAALGSLADRAGAPCDLRVVAALPNRLAAEVLRAPGAGVRFFAPAMRNMLDREVPIVSFAEIDRRAQLQPPRVGISGRPRGGGLAPRRAGDHRRALGEPGAVHDAGGRPGPGARRRVPAVAPPRDTNRAGEAYAAALVATLLDHGWTSGVVEEPLARLAAERASAAAALVLDRGDFGFPDPSEIDAALRAGRVGD